MTTLENRPNTALLVVDVQNGVVEGAPERDAVVANVGSLVEKARQEQVPVVWVQHSDEGLASGSDEWRIVPELTPGDAEPLIEKNYGDSFEDTTLENVLSGLGVGRLVVAGAQTDACIRSTLHGAFARGYDATLVSDAHTTEDQTAVGCAAAGAGDRAHEPVLEVPVGAGADSRDGRDEGCRLRHVLTRPNCWPHTTRSFATMCPTRCRKGRASSATGRSCASSASSVSETAASSPTATSRDSTAATSTS